jgi:hypothetical protein
MANATRRLRGDESRQKDTGDREGGSWYGSPAIVVPAIAALAGVLITAVVALYNASHPVSPRPPAPPLTVTVDPSTASEYATTHFRISGSGFTGDHTVEVKAAGWAAEAPVTEGFFITGFTAGPGDLRPHTYIILVTGLDSQRQMQTALTID